MTRGASMRAAPPTLSTKNTTPRMAGQSLYMSLDIARRVIEPLSEWLRATPTALTCNRVSH
jgi:hypothetical protein